MAPMTKELARRQSDEQAAAEWRAMEQRKEFAKQQGLGYQQAMQDLGIDPRVVAAQNAYIPQNNTNPYKIANVPGQEIAGYQMPSDGGVGPSSYRRPVQQAPVDQGLAAKIAQYLGIK